ncbi:succinic semialdehyde dehydrogenase [Arsenicicoccus dermatophilus]|uniref:succinic semialdehyde dehydrogenase n=1 Tax=Arsenicicoccus dermatophilus TaxID=1076331 RepID=UPI0039171DF7
MTTDTTTRDTGNPVVGGAPRHAVTQHTIDRLTRAVVTDGTLPAHPVSTPLTGEVLGWVPQSSPADVQAAVRAAHLAQGRWARTRLGERARIFLRFHDLVLDHQSELLDLVQLESGKTRFHAFEELADVAMVSRHYARRAAGYLAGTSAQGGLPVLTTARAARRPKGVVGVVAPWNYPLSMSITDAIPALLAGNAVVLRPDNRAALTCLRAVQLLEEAGLPEGVLLVVLGDGPTTGQAVVESTDYVCFTGSTPTGRTVARTCAERLVGCSLELGGKNPMYVAADADVERAARGAVQAAFASAGQLCISVERIIVHQAVADEFLRRFVALTRQVRLSVDLAYGGDMGSLAGEQQLRTVVKHVDDARAKGATVLTGGRARPEIGPYVYEPTILTGVTEEMLCGRGETFGPVVSVYVARDEREAIAMCNDTDLGLNASVWTRDVRRGKALARRIEAGTVGVNDGYAAAWSATGAPMGGMKQSGLGRRHGAEGIRKYTEEQNVAVQRLLPIQGPADVDQARWTGALTTGLRVLRGMGWR